MRDLSDIHFPKAEKIVLVQDNLNTHTPASLYVAFEAAEARRIIERFEWDYTAKHGSWLNLAESELAVLSGQCLDRRIPDAAMLRTEVDAWRTRRNTHNAKAKWHFTTAHARVKLKACIPHFRRFMPLDVNFQKAYPFSAGDVAGVDELEEQVAAAGDDRPD